MRNIQKLKFGKILCFLVPVIVLIQTLQKVVMIFNQSHNFISDVWNILIIMLVIPAYIDSACLRFCKYKQYINMHSKTDI